jgi:hypothetical protein
MVNSDDWFRLDFGDRVGCALPFIGRDKLTINWGLHWQNIIWEWKYSFGRLLRVFEAHFQRRKITHFRRRRIITHVKRSYIEDQISKPKSIATYTGGCTRCHIIYTWLSEYEAVKLNMINLALPDPGMGVGVPLVIPGWELTPVTRS